MRIKLIPGLISLLAISFWFINSSVAQARTVDDSFISSVHVDSVSSQVLGETASYTITFVNSEVLAAQSELLFNFNGSTGCQSADFSSCSSVLSSASLTGLDGEPLNTGPSTFDFLLSADLATGTHTVVIDQITNPISAVAQRVFLSATDSDESILLGDDFSHDVQYSTVSNVTLFGTPLISGYVVNAEQVMMPNVSVNFHDQNWNRNSNTSTDDLGYYVLFQNYYPNEYWTSGTYVASAYPNDNNGYLATDAPVTFDGSTPIVMNITLDASVYFFSGKVQYGNVTSITSNSQPGDVVTNATIYFSPVSGGPGYSANTDDNGEYRVAVRPGTYYANLNLDWSDVNQDQDWTYPGTNKTYTITEIGTKTADFIATITTAKLKGKITAPDGKTVIPGSLMLGDKNQQYSTGVDQAGNYTLNLNPGTYSMSFYPDNQSGIDISMYYYSITNYVVTEGTTNYNITLLEKTASVDVTVTDQDGNPLADVDVSASTKDDWSGRRTDQAGQTTLWVQAGETYQLSPWKDGYIYSEEPTKIKVNDGQSTTASFVMYHPDASISVSVSDSDGNRLEEGFGYVSCDKPNQKEHFGGPINNGTGTVYVLVNESGVFTGSCHLWMNDDSLGAASAQDVSIQDGEVGQIEFRLIDKSASITIYVKDNTGHLVKNADNGEVNVWNEEAMIWQGEPIDDSGKTKMNVVPGTYNAGVWFSDASYISLWNKNNSAVTVKEGASKTVVLTVVKASAQLSGTVLDPTGNEVKHGWVNCGNWEEVSVKGDFEDGEVIDSGTEVENGSFNLPLVAGHTYRCNVGAPPEFIDQGWLSPEDQTVEVNAEGTDLPDLNFKFSKADSKIKGTISFPSTVTAATKNSQRAWCWAWGENGGHSYSEAKGDGSFFTPVQSGEVWHYGCDWQDGETWLTTDDQQVDVTEPQVIEVALKLKPFDAWKIYSPVSQTFDATESVVINLDDGTTLTIPANAIASSGQVTVTATPESKIVYTGDQMLGVPWNFEAFLDGELVETFNAEVTISIPYTNKGLNEFGVDEDSLVSKYYDESSGSWVSTEGVTQNKKTNTLTINTNHFTQYGVTFNQKLTSGLRPATPDKLSVSHRTTHSAKLEWAKSNDKKVTKYTVQVRIKGDKKNENWTTLNSVSGLSKTIKTLNSNTSYQFRVRAKNSGFTSSYSDWVNFRTR